MKTISLYILIIISLILSSCNETIPLRDQIVGEWSMIKKTGGNPEVECDFAENKIIWTITENGISISNNDIFSTLCDAPATANHSYILEENEDEDLFLEIPSIINGQVSLSDSENMSIDGNFTSEGESEDQFVLSFSRPE